MARDVLIDGKWYSTARRPKWTVGDARPFIVRLNKAFAPHGYGVALYGSTLSKGEGRDLDLMLLPYRLDCRPAPEVMPEVMRELCLTEVRKPAYGHRKALGVLSWLWEDARERSYDIAIWPCPTPTTPTPGQSEQPGGEHGS